MKGYLYRKYFHRSVHSVDGKFSGIVCDVDEEKFKVRVKLSEGDTISNWLSPRKLILQPTYYWEDVYKFG